MNKKFGQKKSILKNIIFILLYISSIFFWDGKISPFRVVCIVVIYFIYAEVLDTLFYQILVI